ncbi:MAG: hypothetical protein OSA83_06810 [Pseudomonadales bacterium]|nr:hypothetical protein [Pseudomonadales bacterium]
MTKTIAAENRGDKPLFSKIDQVRASNNDVELQDIVETESVFARVSIIEGC